DTGLRQPVRSALTDPRFSHPRPGHGLGYGGIAHQRGFHELVQFGIAELAPPTLVPLKGGGQIGLEGFREGEGQLRLGGRRDTAGAEQYCRSGEDNAGECPVGAGTHSPSFFWHLNESLSAIESGICVNSSAALRGSRSP